MEHGGWQFPSGQLGLGFTGSRISRGDTTDSHECCVPTYVVVGFFVLFAPYEIMSIVKLL